MEAVLVEGLTKSFKTGLLHLQRKTVLKDLSFSVHIGEIFGYLGPNGSGKTTTLKLLMGLVRPDAGVMSILGEPVGGDGWRRRIGFLPENPHFYDYLTPLEYLDYAGRLFSLPRAIRRERSHRLLGMVGLASSSNLGLRRFSKGMIQRLGLAQALINDPDILFLDEPMSGLDPIGRHFVRNLIVDLKREGKTILFSTHILSDAEALCDRIAIIRNGVLVQLGDLDAILRPDASHMEVLAFGGTDQLLADGIRSEADPSWSLVGDRRRYLVPERSLGSTIQAIEASGGRILSVRPIRPSLEEYFFKEMGGATSLETST